MTDFKVLYRRLDDQHVFMSRDVDGLFIVAADLAQAYGMIPGKPVIPVEQFVAWASTGPVVLAANDIPFTCLIRSV